MKKDLVLKTRHGILKYFYSYLRRSDRAIPLKRGPRRMVADARHLILKQDGMNTVQRSSLIFILYVFLEWA